MNKLHSCCFNINTNRVEARFADGSAVAIDCTAIEDKYGNTPAQRAELDWLLYHKPWSMHRWCWMGRSNVSCHSAATTADWKINDITTTARLGEGEAKAGLWFNAGEMKGT